MPKEDAVTVVGAGLAGSEAAWQLACRGVPVRLVEMKPVKFSPAHKSAGFAELVCSNSLRGRQAAKCRRLAQGRAAAAGFSDPSRGGSDARARGRRARCRPRGLFALHHQGADRTPPGDRRTRRGGRAPRGRRHRCDRPADERAFERGP